MNDTASQLPPPVNLAVAYTPVAFRPAFALLLQLDARFADIVRKAREPFATEPALRPIGEPLLQGLGACGDVIAPSALEDLVSAWELMLGEGEWAAQDVEAHAALRGGGVFGSYAAWSGEGCDVSALSHQWARDALRMEFPSKLNVPNNQPLPALPKGRKLRPLSILAMSVRKVTGLRLIGHALTGW